jgi:hypothetical protein
VNWGSSEAVVVKGEETEATLGSSGRGDWNGARLAASVTSSSCERLAIERTRRPPDLSMESVLLLSLPGIILALRGGDGGGGRSKDGRLGFLICSSCACCNSPSTNAA